MKRSTILSIIVVAVIMLVIGTTLGSVYFPVTKTITSTEKTTIVSTAVVSCPNNYPNGADFSHVISIQENSTAYVCVRYYYYNPNSTMSLNTSSIFGLGAYNFNPASNFTISAYPDEISLGGSQAVNEGVSVLYSIHANSNSSGTYYLGIGADIYPEYVICNGLYEIIVGSGNPDYNQGFDSCSSLSTSTLNSEGIIPEMLFAEVVGITNSSS